MTHDERQQSLANARLACDHLKEYATGEYGTIILRDWQRQDIAALIAEFTRLDAGEQKRNAAGRDSGHLGKKFGRLGAKHGKKGGRPRKNGGKK